MSNGLINLEKQSFTEIMSIADSFSKTDFVPVPYKSKPESILVAWQLGHELGLSPMSSLQNISVINGKPSVYGDALLALIKSKSDFEDIDEKFDRSTNTATCILKRKGQTEVIKTFSESDAKLAKLWGKQGPWTQYPERMLQMRARGFALRDLFPDYLCGVITSEEAQDYTNNERIVGPKYNIDNSNFGETDNIVEIKNLNYKPEEEVDEDNRLMSNMLQKIEDSSDMIELKDNFMNAMNFAKKSGMEHLCTMIVSIKDSIKNRINKEIDDLDNQIQNA